MTKSVKRCEIYIVRQSIPNTDKSVTEKNVLWYFEIDRF